MVGDVQIDHLKPDRFAAEMELVAEQDVDLDLADWRAGKSTNDTMENDPTGYEMLPLDAQLLYGVAVEDVDAATAVYQDSGEAAGPLLCSEGGLWHQGVCTRRGHRSRVVFTAPGDGSLRPVHESGDL